jgi:hypothetical protein
MMTSPGFAKPETQAKSCSGAANPQCDNTQSRMARSCYQQERLREPRARNGAGAANNGAL